MANQFWATLLIENCMNECLLAVSAIIVHFFSIMYWLVVSFPSHLGCRLIISYGLPELFW